MVNTNVNVFKHQKIALLNVCGLLIKLDVPEFNDFNKSNSISCVVETKIIYIDVDNLNMPNGYKGIFKCRQYFQKQDLGE